MLMYDMDTSKIYYMDDQLTTTLIKTAKYVKHFCATYGQPKYLTNFKLLVNLIFFKNLGYLIEEGIQNYF